LISLLSGKIEDDRGVLRKRYFSRLIRRPRDHRIPGDIWAEILERIELRSYGGSYSTRAMYLLTATGGVLAFSIGVASFLVFFRSASWYMSSRRPWNYIMLSGMVVCIPYFCVMRRLAPSAAPKVFKQAFLDVGRCPSCAYPVAELATEEDGCCECPECGGAWICPAEIEGLEQMRHEWRARAGD